jgi:tripartite-type tricarboxylate transporter receptor subunit TctC
MQIKKIGLLLLLLFYGFAQAQSSSWSPNKPVRLIIPQVAGGGADAIGRTIGQALAEKIGQPVIVDNRPGTNGGVGMDVLMNSPADGYNLILVFTSLMAINPAVYEKINYDPLRDLKALGAICEVPLVMIASSKVPANNLKELMSSLKSDQQSVFGASSGNGSFSHMMIEILNTKIGVKMTHIPFKGEGPAVAHVLSGQDSIIYVGTPAIILSQVQAGKLKALGVTTAKRMSQIPNVPTLAESGLPDFNESFWYGLAASSNTPPHIIEAYNKAVNEIARADDLQNNLGKMGCNALPLNMPEFTEKVRSDIKKYSSIAKSVNMKVD